MFFMAVERIKQKSVHPRNEKRVKYIPSLVNSFNGNGTVRSIFHGMEGKMCFAPARFCAISRSDGKVHRRNVEGGIWNSGMIEIANVKISYYFVILCYILGILERNKTVSKAPV